MSWLSQALGGAKHLVQNVAKVAANPIVEGAVSLIPGVGIPGAAIIGGLSHLIEPGGNIGSGLTGAATGAASALAGKGVASLFSHLTGIGQSGGDTGATGMTSGGQQVMTDANGNVVLDASGQPVVVSGGGSAADQSIWGKINDAIQGTGGWGAVASALGGDIGQAVNAMGGVQSLPAWAMAGIQAKNAADLGTKASDLANAALSDKKSDWTARAGLRSAGIQGMLNPQTANLAGLMSTSGPYAASMPKPGGVQSLQQFA